MVRELIRGPVKSKKALSVAVAGLLMAAFAISSCGRTGAPSASPSMETTGSTSASSPAPSSVLPSAGGNPPGVPDPWYAVGNKGLFGPTVLSPGVVSFTVTNNDAREHRFDFARTTPGESAGHIASQVGSGHWPPTGVEVLDHGPSQSPTETATIRVDPLAPGSYALVDVASDPRGKPYASRTRFLLIVVVPAPTP